MKTHLLKIPNQVVEQCKSGTDEILRELRREHEAAERRKQAWPYNQNGKQITCHFPKVSSGGAMLLMAVDSSDKTKDVEYIASLFIEGIKKIGAQNAMQALSDNASNSKSAGVLIESKFPHIGLLVAAESRFVSNIIVAERLMEVKEALDKTMVDQDWKEFKVNGKTPVELNARKIRNLLVSETWWDKIDFLFDFFRKFDKDKSYIASNLWQVGFNEEKIKEIFFMMRIKT
ncbi:hypothetical protein GOBAR_AA00795 [Gossypium barbadense]|uniref:DUF659 domain-containing protein n=1 Tax=Gossypium barbadense TaxID=3634 RepID=A0A2P5YVY8_GOSBA|nr:hypothetical protein GOBAR_AA00795 [Gossypium barbadense]